MNSHDAFLDRLLRLGEFVGADVWIAVAAAVMLGLTTGVFVVCVWGLVRATQRQVSELEARVNGVGFAQPPERDDEVASTGGESATLKAMLETLRAEVDQIAGEVGRKAARLAEGVESATATAERLDGLRSSLESQVEARRDLVSRIESRLREQCLQMTTDILRAEGRHLELTQSLQQVQGLVGGIVGPCDGASSTIEPADALG